jgi:ketosteroid isomerase-like protein
MTIRTRHHSFRNAVESGDLDRIMECFAEDAVLHSPITFKPFEGREAIRLLLSILLEVFRDFHYTDELTAGDGTAALIFRTRVGERDVQGLDLIRFDGDGKIADLTVMVRPRSGSEALLAEIGPRLAAALEHSPR